MDFRTAHTGSFWGSRPTQLRPELTGDVHADVAIIGAGYTGLWTAYYLLERDPHLRVAIVEAEYAGFGASGRNGGWCSALFPVGLDTLAREHGRDAAIAQYRAMQGSVSEIGRVVLAEGIDCDWAAGGTIVLARSQPQLARAQADVAVSTRFGFGPQDAVLLDAEQAHGHVHATGVVGGVYTPHCAAIHPRKLAWSLADVVTARGATLFEGSRVVSVEPGCVRTQRARVRADVVVRATEGYTANLPGHERDLAPVYSLMIATEPLPTPVWDEIGLDRRQTFADERHLIVYGQRTADGRLVFGGRGAPYHFGSRIDPAYDEVPAVFAGLQRSLVELFPVLADTAITHAWGGPLGVARDWHASVGLDRDTGMGWAGGYVGDGVSTTNLAGRTLADLITGAESALIRLPWVGHRSRRWEPEPLRWLGANAALRAMQWADASEARRGRPSLAAAAVDKVLRGTTAPPRPSTAVTRLAEKQRFDRSGLDAVLDEVHIGHVGLVDAAGAPVVFPTAVARDGDHLLIHGSTGSPWLRRAASGAPVSVAVTAFDGLVFARSAFESSIHYRSAVLFGPCVRIEDRAEKLAALDVLTEALLPGRVPELRRPSTKELAATLVLRLAIQTEPTPNWSVKVGDGWPEDPAGDVAGPAWAGVVPAGIVYGRPRPAPDLRPGISAPASVRALAEPDARA